VRPAGFVASRQLEAECVDLLERGVTHVVLDLRATDALGPAAIAAIAAVDRRAHRLGSRLSIVLGNDAVASALAHTGLLRQLQLEGPPETFFDWSRWGRLPLGRPRETPPTRRCAGVR
jgi:anti-anti-sigma regulatory factor